MLIPAYRISNTAVSRSCVETAIRSKNHYFNYGSLSGCASWNNYVFWLVLNTKGQPIIGTNTNRPISISSLLGPPLNSTRLLWSYSKIYMRDHPQVNQRQSHALMTLRVMPFKLENALFVKLESYGTNPWCTHTSMKHRNLLLTVPTYQRPIYYDAIHPNSIPQI